MHRQAQNLCRGDPVWSPGNKPVRTDKPKVTPVGMRVQCVRVPPHQSAELTAAEFDLSNSRSLATYHPKEKPFCLHSDVVGADSVVSAPRDRGARCSCTMDSRGRLSLQFEDNPVVSAPRKQTHLHIHPHNAPKRRCKFPAFPKQGIGRKRPGPSQTVGHK